MLAEEPPVFEAKTEQYTRGGFLGKHPKVLIMIRKEKQRWGRLNDKIKKYIWILPVWTLAHGFGNP